MNNSFAEQTLIANTKTMHFRISQYTPSFVIDCTYALWDNSSKIFVHGPSELMDAQILEDAMNPR